MLKIYSASWCEPCKHFKKMLETASIEYENIDIDSIEGSEEARNKGIRGIPTLEYNNKLLVGATSLPQVKEFIA